MKRVWVLLLLFALPAIAKEPMERRLLRTVQVGKLQGVTVEEILEVAKDSHYSFEQHVLARCALVVLGRDEGFPEWPLERLLERTLYLLREEGSHAFQPVPAGMEGFGGEDLVFTVVYALVAAGRSEEAVDILGRSLSARAGFRRGVALQALRNIGTPRATGLIQGFAESGDNRNLAENLLADLHYPFLQDLYEHLPLIPPAERSRESLLQLASEPCTRGGALAIYFLGFLPGDDDPLRSRAELALLREMTRAPCFHNRFFAIRSLALRSPESVGFWVELFRREEDAWQRDQLVRIAFAHFGRGFLSTALELLASEPAQYVQWELMHGNIELRERGSFRDYWDIWLPPTLQFRLNFPGGSGQLAETDLDEMLSWLENGSRPRDPWVHNHLFYALARSVSGASTRRLLRLFNHFSEKADNWWILAPLDDPQALPLLRYWLTFDSDPQQHDELANLVERLAARRDSSRKPGRGPCCHPTRECLLEHVRAGSAGATQKILTEEQAQEWLASVPPGAAEPEMAFEDALERVAILTWPEAKRTERWEHLYGCWLRVEPGTAF